MAAQAGDPPSRALRSTGLRPRKRLGQNFLQDAGILNKIVAAAEVEPGEDVLEIGAGTGVLTRALALRAGRVVAIELDDELHSYLQSELGNEATVVLWHGNALHFDPCEWFEHGYKIVGNIPYYITGPIIRRYLEVRCPPSRLVLMVQREVAQRITAQPGKMSLLAVSVQYYASAEIIARVPAGAFFPRPKVDSAIIRLEPHEFRVDERERAAFFEIVRAGFQAPRKQLANSLGHGLGLHRADVEGILRQADVDGTLRPESLTVAEWQRIASVRNPVQLGPK